ncbi:hypothetical protein FYK55_24215 [Roseiconus nitratireducens]|uniref:Methyl-accepting chemotaxis protein n=1 Tax=Roseiconus nitratireducens TaxID=2605748 RepID=A0A5M6CZI5_9BACT|nr:hypothetical protein [Roseiconus nitratireducens]KAA5539442.1 hypothetical protein FYK55_24215 [Roseiconus nitratireducens]
MKRALRLIPMILGVLGIALCLVALFGLWTIRSRLDRVNREVFRKADSALVAADEQLERTRDQLASSKLTAQGVVDQLKAWSQVEAVEELDDRMQLSQKLDRFSFGLRQADHWMQMASTTADHADGLLSMAHEAGLAVDPGRLDGLRTDIQDLRSKLTDASEKVDLLSQRWSGEREDSSETLSAKPALQTASALIATVSDVETRLSDFQQRLGDVRTLATSLEAKSSGWIFWVAVALTAFVLWMAAGQYALFRLATRPAPNSPTGDHTE